MTVASHKPPVTFALIVAAGKGLRAGLAVPKQFAPVRGKPMLLHSVEAFSAHPAIDRIFLVVAPGQEEQAAALGLPSDQVTIISGGDTRQQSVRNGLEAMADDSMHPDHVLIHDAARPFLPSDVIDRLCVALDESSAAIPVLPMIDSVVLDDDTGKSRPFDRSKLHRVQTPQAFHFPEILSAHRKAKASNSSDDAGLISAAGIPISTVAGDEALAKFTTPQDFEQIAPTARSETRMGMGYDVHRLAEGEELWLGGVQIAYEKGLVGHSDADVLLHAITDALLGAIAEGDIGDHFPPSDPQWRGVASHIFLDHARKLLEGKKGRICNLDATIICEQPKIKPHREAIRNAIATCLQIEVDRVSVKATTTEGVGFTGRGEAIAAQAVVTVELD